MKLVTKITWSSLFPSLIPSPHLEIQGSLEAQLEKHQEASIWMQIIIQGQVSV